MGWKPEYAENRRKKEMLDPQYRAKRKQQAKTRTAEENKVYMEKYHLKNKVNWNKRTREQRDKYNEARRKKYAEDDEYREEQKKQVKEWQQNNPDKRKAQRLKKFGITLAQYNQLLEGQGNKCAICGYDVFDDPNFFPVVDHDHESGEVRGLLCMNCNMGVGKFQDNPDIIEKAASYLRRNRGVKKMVDLV